MATPFAGNLAAAVKQIYARCTRNVLPPEGRNGQDEVVLQASALALDGGVAVPRCDLLRGAGRPAVTQGRHRDAAHPRERDEARTLCRLRRARPAGGRTRETE